MIIDPAVLSVTFPNKRRLHYWAKDSMFKSPYAAAFLNDCGVVPVDRKTKNNAQLYAATFEVLKLDEAVAVFPEGTSHTLPRLGTLKDGTSFVRLYFIFLYWDHMYNNPKNRRLWNMPKLYIRKVVVSMRLYCR
jgi:1-acyl-sn-glycerol-3-phosphate acyltransferase